METSGYITVGESKNHHYDFVNFMNATTEALKLDSEAAPSKFIGCNSAFFENEVINCMKSKAPDFHFEPGLIEFAPRQHFPDIISNKYFGVEVKSTKSNSWKSTGSSIVESLRVADVKKIFMFFGILSKDNIDFRCKPYEECLSEIAVTHSPRYLVDMDLSPDSTIFGKMNISYEEFRNLGDLQIDKFREHYRSKYKDKDRKSMPWWIGSDEDSYSLLSENEFSLISDAEVSKKDYYISRCYALFPEVLGKKQDRYRKPALWLCVRHSMICSNIRDFFTAGGTGNIYINDELKWSNVPKVICNLIPHLSLIERLYSEMDEIKLDLYNFASFSSDSNITFEGWKQAADYYINIHLNGANEGLCIDELLKYNYEKRKTVNKKHCFYIKTK